MGELFYRIKPIHSKRVEVKYYMRSLDGSRYWTITELYRYGQGFREIGEPFDVDSVADDGPIDINPNLAWGMELEDLISLDYEFDESFSEDEMDELKNLYENGNDEDYSGASWLIDYQRDWDVFEEEFTLYGPYQIDVIDEENYNQVVKENIPPYDWNGVHEDLEPETYWK